MTTNVSEAQKVEETPLHNLFTREVRPIRDWYEWLEHWQAITTIEEMKGLLHSGFEKPIGYAGYSKKQLDAVDRIIFYFGIADGWAERCLLESPTDSGYIYYNFGWDNRGNRIKKSQSESRQVVAEKAFDVLCLNFFRPEMHEMQRDKNGYDNWERFIPYWEKEIATARLLPAIANFFRAEGSKFGSSSRLTIQIFRYVTMLGVAGDNREMIGIIQFLYPSLNHYDAPRLISYRWRITFIDRM